MRAAASTLDPIAFDLFRRVGGQKLVNEMVRLFLRHAPDRIAQVSAAAAKGDCSAILHALHSLRATSGQMGARELHRLCEVGEELATRREVAALPAFAETLREAFTEAKPALKAAAAADLGSGAPHWTAKAGR